jgi:hypothetical protein
MSYPSTDFDPCLYEPQHPVIYEVVDGRWRGTRVTRLGRCVATADTLDAVQSALAELVRLQITEECHDSEAWELLRKSA